MEKKGWTLLAIYYANENGLSPVQLQKSLFLLGKNMPNSVGDNYYYFIPYNYGPFDQTIYADAEILSEEGLISINYIHGRRWPQYFVTSNGIDYAKDLEEKAPDEAVSYLRKLVKWVRSLTFQELLRAIYHVFPEFKVNSVFQE
ncbi:MAG: hypothetical protein ACTSPI_16225 [Candidatus Heimdallarchaeaceae archaeon]